MELETNNIIVGAGLISLDVLIWDGQRVPISYYVGGTCGNVMMILSHMGWDAYPQDWLGRREESEPLPTVRANLYE